MMGWATLFVLVWIMLTLNIRTGVISQDQCPESCKCSVAVVRTRDGQQMSSGQKVVCVHWKKWDFSTFPLDTVHLVISNAGLTKVPARVLSSLPNLVKVDFSKNAIFQIDDDAFSNLTFLEKIDLSENALISLFPEMISALSLPVRLNMEGNPVICDCHLKWMVDPIRKKQIRLTSKSACQYPIQFRGFPIYRMKKKDMHCNYPLQLPILDIQPVTSQLVFEGDRLAFRCRVTRVDGLTHLLWLLNGREVLPNPVDAIAIAVHNSNESIVESSVVVGHLRSNHSGSWMCKVETSKGNAARTTSVVVIPGKAKYCSTNTTLNNRGTYSWPQTLSGVTVALPCAGIPMSLNYHQALAYHTCQLIGSWSNLLTDDCPFVSEVTKVLEQFSKTNLTISKSVLETARGLRNYTGDGRMLNDPMDVVFISRTLENYLEFVPKHKEVGDVLVDVISTVMHLNHHLLRKAQKEDGACSRLLRVLSSLTRILPDTAFSRYHDNLVLEEFLVKMEGFTGLRCTLYQEKRHRSLHCISVNASLALTMEKELEASIYIPPSIITYLGQATNSHKLQFVLYQDARLFQRPPGRERRDVTSPVIATRAAQDIKLANQLVEVILKVPAYTDDVQPAWWDSTAAGGQGDWMTEGCSVVAISGPLVTFTCTHLGTFGLLQNVMALHTELSRRKAQFRVAAPAVYVGSFISFNALAATNILYWKAWKCIHLSKNIKHSLFNTWLALALLILVYTLGVLQVDFDWLCQGVGVVIHYLTLCVLMWMLITVNNMYKKVKKKELPETISLEESQQPIPPKPILRFYFLGWGVGIIVCGISAAVHIEKYAGNHYCFLSTGPSLSAVYGPVSILLLVLISCFLLVSCTLRARQRNGETPLVTPQAAQSNDEPLSTDEESVADTEFSVNSQLRAVFIVLLFFGFSWFSAAFCTAFPLSLPFGELIFSLTYCLFSSFLGLFVFAFYCYSRQDLWLHLGKVEILLEQDAEQAVPSEEEVAGAECHARVEASEPQDDQQTWKSFSEKLVNASLKSERIGWMQCQGLGAPDIFYNPRQSNVARRFFEKNRRRQQLKLMHKNNLAKEAAINSEPPSYNKNSDSDLTNVYGESGRPPMTTSHSYSGISSDVVFELRDRELGSQTARFKALQKERVATLGEELTNRNLLPLVSGVPLPDRTKIHVLEVSGKENPSCSLSCCSDVTESSATSLGRRRRRSRVRNKWQKPARQHSWDDKCCKSKLFTSASEDGGKRRKGKSRSALSDERFSRSKSVYEQTGLCSAAARNVIDTDNQVRQETSL